MGAANRVLEVPKPERERVLRPVRTSPDTGWSVLGWFGLVFALVGGLDLVLTWYPLSFGSPEWEFGTITSSLDSLPVLTLGLALLLGAGLAQGARWRVRGASAVLIVLALGIIAAGVMYATSIPLALNAVADPVMRVGLKKAMVKTGVQVVAYPVAFLWIALLGWRLTAVRRASGARRVR